MWDRLITDCNVATMVATDDDPLGIITNAAIGIDGGRIVRIAKRTELAGFRACEVTALDGAWVTPGLIDCHTHLVFGGNRADEHAMRRAGASYEEIAKAGGGILSTVEKTRAASEEQLLASARRRLDALASSGVTTIEVKSGYGLDPDSELKMLRVARALDGHAGVKVVATLLALHALPADADRSHYVDMVVKKTIPTVAAEGLATSVDAFCEGIGFTPAEVEAVFTAARHHGLGVRLHAEQLSNLGGARLAARYKALSADHLEHLDEEGAAAMAAAGTVAVLLPGAFYCLRETRRPPVDLLRKAGVAMAVATDCNPGTSPTLSLPLMMNMATTLFGLTPEEAIMGTTIHAARALGLAHERGVLSPGKSADLCVWKIEGLAELGYWIGLPGPHLRIAAGQDRGVK
ncbi:imidazolonepropionase [Sphingomicrobium lutaoense]|uniref:Imidazolonepropionase n=1 Tax=Sphingomicrobium lutaoense TaxID=515949 RepID=A0A839Z5J7_9SPHN|nr:imidazolonepropionase [Sphingomicrobium lutaoense]MBB3764945.1 imidazolonepropionase [Sphingomicrobium lutaoense]